MDGSDSGRPTSGKANAESLYRIEVDMDLCKGHAACMGEAPELFHVDDTGKLTVLNPYPGDALRDKAQAAAKYCPTQAIRVVEHGDS